ncbi:MAG: hypothetical protein CL678_00885 [Bdellovibrionaceae bacterium]|nr:hypothetical protein [Pseudobdellovibrionaceae bacterium]|tara:strand:+ start:1051 stop:1674 length:624 start_codon:yes stop_codon:yes gene_type:complete
MKYTEVIYLFTAILFFLFYALSFSDDSTLIKDIAILNFKDAAHVGLHHAYSEQTKITHDNDCDERDDHKELCHATNVFGYITFVGTILYMLCFAAYFMKDRLQLEKYPDSIKLFDILAFFCFLFGSIIFTILLIVDAIHLKDEMENQELHDFKYGAHYWIIVVIASINLIVAVVAYTKNKDSLPFAGKIEDREKAMGSYSTMYAHFT